VVGRIVLMKNSKDTIGNQTRDLTDCSSVPQTTAPSRTRSVTSVLSIVCKINRSVMQL